MTLNLYPRRSRHRLMAAGVIALLVAGWAAAVPNFSGEWTINVDKSDFGPQPPQRKSQTIEHKDPQLTIKVVVKTDDGERRGELKYTTDGKECTNDVMGNVVKSVAKWDGAKLVIDSKANFNGNDIALHDVWSLAAGGKTLTIERHFKGPNGEADQKLVMDKQ